MSQHLGLLHWCFVWSATLSEYGQKEKDQSPQSLWDDVMWGDVSDRWSHVEICSPFPVLFYLISLPVQFLLSSGYSVCVFYRVGLQSHSLPIGPLT